MIENMISRRVRASTRVRVECNSNQTLSGPTTIEPVQNIP